MNNSPKRILVIEDDALITLMYQSALSGSNFQLDLVSDGLSGWTFMQANTPDLVILDFMLPKLNGIEILRKMRADERLKSIPVILMSSLSDDADRARAMDAGATMYWVKNEVNMVDFSAKISQVLAQ